MPRRKQERETYWRKVLTRQSKSGLSIAGFCRQESIAQPSFYAWRRTIRERDEAVAKIAENGRGDLGRGSKLPSFVPVCVEEVMSAAGQHQPIRVRWPGGVDIDVPASTSPRDITAVLQSVRDIVPLMDGAGR